jgi:hypothetical protein
MTIYDGTQNTARLSITSTGKVGVGTTAPANVFHVASTTNAAARFDITTPYGPAAAASLILRNINNTVGNSSGIMSQNSAGAWVAWMDFINVNHAATGAQTGAISFSTMNAGSYAQRMYIKEDGNVGIGTTSPGAYRLAVNGSIRAKEVVVDTGWSDYVFAPSYHLRPLREIANYIRTNHHLPEIPSETEVKENGVSVGDMQAKLLAKIEELTLHLIQMDQENRELKSRLDRMEASGNH